MAISSPGIGSNLDVNGIVSQLMAVEQQPLTALARKEATQQNKIAAYGALKGSLTALQGALSGLSDASKFQQSKNVAVNDTSMLTASATSIASAGSYAVEVTKLAQSQKLLAAGQASSTAVVGSGTLTFSFGTVDKSAGSFDSVTGKYTDATFTGNGAAAKTVTIDASNNSLEGIRDAINKAGIGVTASVLNDGSGSPYRLSLSTNSSGATNSLKIDVTGDPALQALLAHNPAANAGQALQETVTAQNAEFKLDGVTISKASNTVTDVIQGVTLNLLKANVGSAARITVSTGSANIADPLSSFVKAYNDLNKQITDMTAYDPKTKQGGVLLGDSAVRTIQNQLRNALNQTVEGVSTSYNSLSKIGVAFQKDGSLLVDNAKLQAATSNAFNDVVSLLSNFGTTTDTLVKYNSATTSTKAGTYDVALTALASKGTAVGSAVSVSNGVDITAGVNDSLTVTLDNITATVTLGAGNYSTLDALTAEIQSKINAATEFRDAGNTLAITGTGSVGTGGTSSSFTLTATSNRYGSTSNVNLSGSAFNSLFGAAALTTAAGVDVAGSIGGFAATGSGQKLTANTGPASGLSLTITGGTVPADRGTVTYTRGLGGQLNTLMGQLLGSTGPIDAKTSGLNSSIEDIGRQRETLNRRLQDIEKRYRTQFSNLDVLLGNMSRTSSYLTQQLAALTAG
jgi:flagellar hook-associated protein 2